jgi:hypothetical protein
MRARLVRISELIESVGLPNVKEPHVRHVRGAVREIVLMEKPVLRAHGILAFAERILPRTLWSAELGLDRAKGPGLDKPSPARPNDACLPREIHCRGQPISDSSEHSTEFPLEGWPGQLRRGRRT